MPHLSKRSYSFIAAMVGSHRVRKDRSIGLLSSNWSSGNALETLGERESGTARLEEAVAAYREALQENTRARVPRMGRGPRWVSATRLKRSASGRTGRRGSRRAVTPLITKPCRNLTARARLLEWAADTQINLGNALKRARRAGERNGAARGGCCRLSRSLAGIDPRARAARLGCYRG